jgi:hypothetical protein
MPVFAQTQSLDKTLSESRSIFERITDSFFNGESIIVFVVSIVLALLLGRIAAAFLRRVTKLIGDRADKIEDLDQVTRLRRLETLIVLSIAAIRTLLVVFAIYFWWTYTHETNQSTAILGASAILTLILSGALFNILRDIASGSAMMAEHWFGVGDHIRVEPLLDAQGVVERVTLRSTKIRKVTGEILWVNNKDIAGVSVTPKGVRTIAIELYTKDVDKALKIVEDTNLRLPQGALAVVNPLSVMTTIELSSHLWHITAISEVAPGREWMMDKFAIDIIKELDEKHKVLVHEPMSRYADSEAERRFARAIHNATKSRVQRRTMAQKVAQKRAAQKRKNSSKAAEKETKKS